MSNPFGRVSEGTNLKMFSSQKYLEGTKEFLQSNSIVAKFAFLLLVLILFILALRLGTSLLAWIFSPKSNPILIDGMIDSKHMMRIPQNPGSTGAIPIQRSVNKKEGLEFTWSVWMYIDDLTYRENEYRHVFHKGNDNINLTNVPIGMNQPNNGPGLYIAPSTNNLVVVMNTFNKINEEIIIEDIPINKWINVIIRVSYQNRLDVYINGRLARRHILNSVPKQNYGDVFVSMNGGFSGHTSSLRYFTNAIGTNEIQSIVNDGPNMTPVDKDLINSKPRYLSLRWFFTGSNDMYNP